MTIIPNNANIYIHAFGKAVKITAISTSQEEVGKFLLENAHQSVIAVHDPYIFIAEYDDLGKDVKKLFPE